MTQRLEFYSYDSIRNPWCAGGGAYRDFEVLKRQRKPGRDIILYVGAYPGCGDGEEEGIRIRPLGCTADSYLLSRLTYALIANVKVLFSRAQLIGHTISIYAPILTGLLRPDRFYMVFHHFIGTQSFRKLGPIGLIAYAAEWLLFRYGRNIIVINRRVEAKVKAMNPGARVLRSRNGFDSELLAAPATERQPAYILFLGRFDVYMKGLDLLIRAFRECQRALPQSAGIRLVLAGRASPEALAAVQALREGKGESGPGGAAAEAIELKANVSPEEKAELLSGCLFFCSPSRFEGFGIAALEASAAGKAVLVTETDGFRDSVDPGRTGLMVPVDDARALQEGMAALILDRARREAMGEAGREWARNFQWDRIAEEEMRWIESGSAGPGATP